MYIAFVQKKSRLRNNIKKLILLDSDSNELYSVKKYYITKIWETDVKMSVRTNEGGRLILKKKYIIPQLREHWFKEE